MGMTLHEFSSDSQAFYINLFIGGAMAPVMLLLLPSKSPSDLSVFKCLKQLDWLGAILV